LSKVNDWEKYKEKLDEIYELVEKEKNVFSNCRSLGVKRFRWVKALVKNIEKQKSVIAVVITSLLKKIVVPEQDIRLHRDSFKGGYSGRSLDTKVVTPWLKEKFQRYAPKESGWLTRSFEQDHPYSLDYPGKIKYVKEPFLRILNDVEENNTDPALFLKCLLCLLLKRYSKDIQVVESISTEKRGEVLTIDIIIKMLEEHFQMKNASRLPVLAIYCLYKVLIQNLKEYEDKYLEPLKVHTASDKYTGFGDIEIYYKEKNEPYEIVEIKHNIKITPDKIIDIAEKIRRSSVITIKKYYILTTAKHEIEDKDKERIDKLIIDIKKELNVLIIPNGIIPTIKYYLRFFPNLAVFLECYKQELIREFRNTTDIKENHIRKWEKIEKKYLICN